MRRTRSCVLLACALVAAYPAPVCGADEPARRPDALGWLYHHAPSRGLALSVQSSGRPALPTLVMNYQHAPESVAELGGVRPAAAGQPVFKPIATAYGGGFALEQPAFQILCTSLCPGAVITTQTDRLELFVGLGEDGKTPLPQFVAFSAGGRAHVQRATDPISPRAMDAPWLLIWWGDRSPFTLARHVDYSHVSSSRVPIDVPLLVLCEQRVRKIDVAERHWSLTFDQPAGTVVIMPLFGQRVFAPIPTEERIPHPLVPGRETDKLMPWTASWADALPARVSELARQWVERLRCIPVGVEETFELPREDADVLGVKITEAFTYREIDDAWRTTKKSWALVPPIFALSQAMKGPVAVGGDSKDTGFLGAFGPALVLDDQKETTFVIRIPGLQRYVEQDALAGAAPEEIAALARSHATYNELLRKLRREIDVILEHDGHMAPYLHKGITTGGSFHWANPGETVVTLAWALPYLEPDKAIALRACIRREFGQYDPLLLSSTVFAEGVRREHYDWDPEGKRGRFGENRTPILQNVYATALYVDHALNDDTQAVEQLWARIKSYLDNDLEQNGYLWDGGETPKLKPCYLGDRFPALHSRLNGYLGYVRLARRAGDEEAEALGTALLARGLAVLHAMAHYHQYLYEQGQAEGLANMPAGFPPDAGFHGYRLPMLSGEGLVFGNGFRNHEMPQKFFSDLSPEVASFMRDHSIKPATLSVKWMQWKCPGLWMSRGLAPFSSFQSENWLMEPWVPWAHFLGLTATATPAEELCWYVADSPAKFGDLYYIQRLCLALRAFGLERK